MLAGQRAVALPTVTFLADTRVCVISLSRCVIRSECTVGDYRRIARWEHANVLDTLPKR